MKKAVFTIALSLIFTGSVFAADSFFGTVSLNASASYGGAWGGPMKEEKNSAKASVTYSDGTTKTGSPDHYIWSVGAWADIMPFNPILSESGRSGYVFGIRPKVAYYNVNQEINIGGGEYEEKKWSAKYMEFKSVLVGPVFKWAPMVRTKNDKSIAYFTINLFALGGPILGGKMHPAAIMQEENQAPAMETDISGLRFEGGLGLEYSGGSMLHAGLNLIYGYNSIKMKKNYYSTVSSRTHTNDFNFELYAGVSF